MSGQLFPIQEIPPSSGIQAEQLDSLMEGSNPAQRSATANARFARMFEAVLNIHYLNQRQKTRPIDPVLKAGMAPLVVYFLSLFNVSAPQAKCLL